MHGFVSTARTIACAAVLLSALSQTTIAQQVGSAGLRGTVVDEQGRGIAAKITIVYLGTGLGRETYADERGYFSLAQLPAGAARVVIEASGFATQTLDAVGLEVGQVADANVRLQLSRIEERVTVAGSAGKVDVLGSEVGAVLSAHEIASLPLNGRNFLELALLAPGNAPAPAFDPTKANSVLISSAGQLGRGGNITIDGQDDNDDVVGGPLQNVPQDAVQEFQMATNRFSAELGRSAGSVINVVTRSGSDALHGSASVFARDRRIQSLPATIDERGGEDLPFDRQQYSATVGGPAGGRPVFWFGAVEVRNQDGAVLVGERVPAFGAIAQTFAAAPLDDLLTTFRVDARLPWDDDLTVRYSGQREDDISASTLDRPAGSASQRQKSRNRHHAVLGSWTKVLSRAVNEFSASYSDFDNAIVPVQPGVQLTFPSLQDGSSFRVPQGTVQQRWQFSNATTLSRGEHQWKFGAQVQRVDAAFDLGVFRDGRVEFVEDFPAFDRTGDGRVNDDDLLFSVTLRSGYPDRDLEIPDADNVHVAAYVQDDWRIGSRLTLNLGVRYEIDTDVTNISRVDELNPIVAPFVTGPRRRDTNNWGPRIGFNWATADAATSVRGGYGLYYDRVTLQIQSLERGLDGRALPIEVRAGNVFFIDPATGQIPPFAPTVSNPFTGFILPGAGASGINIIDSRLQNPMVHQVSLGIERQIGRAQLVRADVVHNDGRHFIIGRTVGTVFNPVVGGPDRVVNLESSAETKYDALLLGYERRFDGRFGARAGYTFSKSFNYANDDQIPFANGPIDPNDLRREFGPTPNDRRHRLTVAAAVGLPGSFQLSGLWTLSSGVPMDILMPDGQSRVPVFQRNAGGRQFRTGRELNGALRGINEGGGIDGQPLPLVPDDARFNDHFNALDLRLSRSFALPGAARAELLVEVFNLFNVTNVLGVTSRNYSGYSNALVRDSSDPSNPGYLRSSRFGTPVSTAGGVFGSGGPRALQLGGRITF
jgi:outer membrane receptor protein involved in Fe transport